MIRVTEKQAEQAGREAGYFGPNLTNCHFTYFATPELTKAWERGNEQARSNSPMPMLANRIINKGAKT